MGRIVGIVYPAKSEGPEETNKQPELDKNPEEKAVKVGPGKKEPGKDGNGVG